MTAETQDLLNEFFSAYAAAVSSANPSAFTREHFDHGLLCDTDQMLPFSFEKSDQRALARSERERQARHDPRAISFEIADMVGCQPGQVYVTVAWHLNVDALVRKTGEGQVVIGYLLRFEDGAMEILAATRLADENAAAGEPDGGDDLVSSESDLEDRLATGYGDRRPGYVAG